MIIDMHVHAFPKEIRNNREKYFNNEPEFKNLYKSYKQKLVGETQILKTMDNHKIDTSVIFGFPWRNHNICNQNNNYIIKLIKKYPKRFKGFCCINPLEPNSYNEIKRCLDIGFSGVGEIAFYNSSLDDICCSTLEPIMNLCKSYNVPIMLHTNEEVGHLYPGKTKMTLFQIYNFIKHYPENNIILSHWGGGLFFFNIMKKEVTNVLKNTYYDIAASPYLYKDLIYKIAKQIIGVDNILFGTDYPLLKPNIYLDSIFKNNFNKEEISKICYKNAKKLLKLN